MFKKIKAKLKKYLVKIHWISSVQFGFDIRRFLFAFLRIPGFIIDLISFKKKYKGKLIIVPSLHDKYTSNGDYEHEYFWQDLFVSQAIYLKNPELHIDIGSRIDGFIANLATCMNVTVFDIREQNVKIPNVNFEQADLMSSSSVSKYKNKFKSISCLHTIEHFGLGRYGDPIMVDGFDIGFTNIVSMIDKGGLLYLSTPISNSSYVEFNSNRVTDYKKIIEFSKNLDLTIKDFRTITANGVSKSLIENPQDGMKDVGDYILGLFVLEKN